MIKLEDRSNYIYPFVFLSLGRQVKMATVTWEYHIKDMAA